MICYNLKNIQNEQLFVGDDAHIVPFFYLCNLQILLYTLTKQKKIFSYTTLFLLFPSKKKRMFSATSFISLSLVSYPPHAM